MSSCAHSFMTSFSVLVGLAVPLGAGRAAVLSKCAQLCVASVASQKWAAKAAQLLLSSLGCGSVVGRTRKDILNLLSC